MTPLFVALKTEYWKQFRDGTKRDELRLYGPHWNERTCAVGRAVTLSKGYGKSGRMSGVVRAFKRQRGSTFGRAYREAIQAVYGTLDVEIACISIDLLEPEGQGE